ncbi:MAG: hypothetical protein PPP56_10780 [Longimonas sp.]|uniref:YkvA family protein n=1 Tax=Longimonas sp. TaxID=2039626 RepID=UPI0033494A5D
MSESPNEASEQATPPDAASPDDAAEQNEENGTASSENAEPRQEANDDTSTSNKSASDTEDSGPSLAEAFTEAAQEALEKRLQWVAVLRKAVQRLGEDRSVPAVIADDVATLFRMLQAWRKGRYPNFPWRSVGVLTLAVLYFAFLRGPKGKSLAGIGVVDDAAVLAFVVRTAHKELNRFRTWERNQ